MSKKRLLTIILSLILVLGTLVSVSAHNTHDNYMYYEHTAYDNSYSQYLNYKHDVNYLAYEYQHTLEIYMYYSNYTDNSVINPYFAYDDSHLFYAYIQRINKLSESPEWIQMYAYERWAAIALTPEEMAAMSTETLLRATMENPVMVYLFASNSLHRAFQGVYDINPGLRELSNRNDFGDAFIHRYTTIIQYSHNYQHDTNSRLAQPLTIPIMEIVMAQPKIHRNISAEQATKIVESFVEKRTNEMTKCGMPYAFIKAIAEIEQRTAFDSYIPIQIETFQGLWTQIRTPRWSPVWAIATHNIQDWTNAQLTQINNEIRSLHPSATILRNASRRYNCHSFALHNRNLPNNIWLQGFDMYPFFRDGSLIRAGSTPMNGDIIDWFASDHTGVVFNVNHQGGILVDSKWGELPLMRHLSHDVPPIYSTFY